MMNTLVNPYWETRIDPVVSSERSPHTRRGRVRTVHGGIESCVCVFVRCCSLWLGVRAIIVFVCVRRHTSWCMSSCLGAFVLIPLCALHCVYIVVHMPLVAVRLSNNKHFVWQCYIHVCVRLWRTNVDSICIMRCFVLCVVCRCVLRACAQWLAVTLQVDACQCWLWRATFCRRHCRRAHASYVM